MKIFIFPALKKMQQRYALGVVSILLAAGIMTTAVPSQKNEPIDRGRDDTAKIALTCNVFWGEEFLPGMLKTLDENNVKITFFIGGTWAKSNPELLKTIAAKGHELANHSYNHPHPNSLSKEKNQEQITKTEAIIEEVTGIKTKLYAPPYGEYNDTVLMAAKEINYPTIMWSIDTVDWKHPPPEIIKNRIIKKAHNGAIVLMHPTEQTSKALPEIIKELKNMGYTLTTVSDMI